MYHMQTNRHFRINRPEINFSCLKYIENLNKSLLIFFIFSHVSHMLILVLKWIIFAIFWSFFSTICWFPHMYKNHKTAYFCFSCIIHMQFSKQEMCAFFVKKWNFIEPYLREINSFKTFNFVCLGQKCSYYCRTITTKITKIK